MIGRLGAFAVSAPLRRAVTATLIGCALCGAPVSGQDPRTDATVQALNRLEKALENEPGLARETKDALSGLIVALRSERTAPEESEEPAEPVPAQPLLSKGEVARAVDEYLEARPPAREESPWEGALQRLSVFGDIRLRSESSWRLEDNPSRHRARTRFRVGANYRLHDDLLVGARLATGDLADPNSPHLTFGDVFRKFQVSLDRAFLTYRPSWAEGAWVTTGKFAHPFLQNPVYAELVWDADVQPEGIVGGYAFSGTGRLQSVGFTAGRYLLLEQSRGGDAGMTVLNSFGRVLAGEDVEMNLGVGYYLYSNDLVPDGSRTILDANRSNFTVDLDGDGRPDDFLSRFGVLNPILSVSVNKWRNPLVFSGEYILNTRARTDQDQGWALGAAFGKTQNRGDWRLYYQWQVVEQDAAFSRFVHDDFLFATNHRSHIFGVNNQVTNKIGLHLWWLVSAREKPSGPQQWRFRLDVNTTF